MRVAWPSNICKMEGLVEGGEETRSWRSIIWVRVEAALIYVRAAAGMLKVEVEPSAVGMGMVPMLRAEGLP